MRARQPVSLLVLPVLLLLCACNPAPSQPNTPVAGGGVTLTWNKDPKAIIVRLDRTLNGESNDASQNRLPLCTIYGDGHVVWVNPVPPVSEEVLEARIDDTTFRAFLEDFLIKGVKFYSLPDYAAAQLPPEGRVAVESITVSLSGEVRTIRNFGPWPNSEFQLIQDKCSHLTQQPVAYLPTGAWLTVVPAPANSGDPRVSWQSNAPFKLADAAAGGQPMWISGPLLNLMWTMERKTLSSVQWFENNKGYKAILQVPGISREAPAAPAVTPTMPPVAGATARPTIAPTVTSVGKPPATAGATTASSE